MIKNSCDKHKMSVNGWNGDLKSLAEEIHRLRYDSVREFYEHSAAELKRQSEGDFSRGRKQLAKLLAEAEALSREQEKLFAKIWALCEPHMKEE